MSRQDRVSAAFEKVSGLKVFSQVSEQTAKAIFTLGFDASEYIKVEGGKNWDHRFLVLAQHIASWSKDPTTKVGCVIVDEQRHIVSTGYNGFPRGVNDTHARLHEREVKYKLVIHAEKNALLHAQRDLRGGTLYVWPMPPCSQCAAAIIQSGIKRVVSVSPSVEHLARWGEDMKMAQMMYNEAEIDFDEVVL
jgi:dCMP deaminase